MNTKFDKNRRSIIKALFSLGILSIFPIRLNGFSQKEDCITTTDIEGPFYTPNSPNISILTPPDITSNFLFITGTVYANDCITPIPNALIDVWHANQGEFDEQTNSYLNSNYDETLYRAQLYTDNNGNYAYQTILPGKYLNGNYYRPSHIHYKCSYLNENQITTQLYFEGDTSIDLDPWASNILSQNRIIPLEVDDNNNSHGVFDITLNVSPSQIEQSVLLNNNQLIQSIHPNPINDNTTIYLQNNHKNISIEICNVAGQTIKRKDNITAQTIKLKKLFNCDFKKGIYIIRSWNSQGIVNSKRIIIP